MCYNNLKWLVNVGLLPLGVMCVTLFEKLSPLIAAATLVVNIIFLITR